MNQAEKKTKQTARLSIPVAEKIALSINEAAAVGTLGRTKIYEAIRAGRLRSRLVGGRRTILRSDLEQFYAAE